jgi:glyoxylase-like metal-dependent hydrolase (beta-lactamase superfamily II)
MKTLALAAAWALCASIPAAGGERWCDALPRPAYASLERIPVPDDWFQVYRVGDGVFAVYEPYQFQEVISYLIVGTSSALVLDTGLGMSSMRRVVSSLTRLPVRVLNSHTHFDHVGGNAEFDRVLGLDTPFTRRNAAGQPHDLVRGEVVPEALCRALPAGASAEEYRSRPFVITAWVRDGDVIDLGGRQLEILSVPGHTPDAVALLDRAAGLLFTGDTFYEGQIWLVAPETDLAAYGRSLDRLARLAPSLKQLLPAHNIPVASPSRLLELKEAFEAVRSGRARGTVQPEGGIEYVFDGFSLLLAAPMR